MIIVIPAVFFAFDQSGLDEDLDVVGNGGLRQLDHPL